jgi:predicted nuclease of predicted toxin-antitoxin system
MKLLFDQNISFRINKKIIGHFPESAHVSDCGLMDSEDSVVWNYAKINNYSIVTFDSDFYDISLINGHPPKIIWLRLGNITTDELAGILIENRGDIDRFLHDENFKELSCLELD